MKNPLLTVALVAVTLLTACPQPLPKVITKPEIGMHLSAFQDLCGPFADDSTTSQTEHGDTLTLKNNPTNYNGDPHPYSCVGTFVFVNNKLTSITR